MARQLMCNTHERTGKWFKWFLCRNRRCSADAQDVWGRLRSNSNSAGGNSGADVLIIQQVIIGAMYHDRCICRPTRLCEAKLADVKMMSMRCVLWCSLAILYASEVLSSLTGFGNGWDCLAKPLHHWQLGIKLVQNAHIRTSWIACQPVHSTSRVSHFSPVARGIDVERVCNFFIASHTCDILTTFGCVISEKAWIAWQARHSKLLEVLWSIWSNLDAK